MRSFLLEGLQTINDNTRDANQVSKDAQTSSDTNRNQSGPCLKLLQVLKNQIDEVRYETIGLNFLFPTDSQVQILQDALECDIDETHKTTQSHNWALRQALSEDRWRAARPMLFDSLLASNVVQVGICDHCATKEAVVRCKDCLPLQRYCGTCDASKHKNLVLHNREMHVNGFYKPIPPSTVVNDVAGENVLHEHGTTDFKNLRY